MLRLSNIKREHGIISANYEPEASGEFGFVAVNISTGDVVEEKRTSLDGCLGMYLGHAAQSLRRDLKYKEQLPETYLVMWY